MFFGEFAEGFESFLEGVGPGGAAVEADAVAVFLLCGEEGAGGDRNAGGEGLVEEVEGIDLGGHLDPEDVAALGAGDLGAIWE